MIWLFMFKKRDQDQFWTKKAGFESSSCSLFVFIITISSANEYNLDMLKRTVRIDKSDLIFAVLPFLFCNE